MNWQRHTSVAFIVLAACGGSAITAEQPTDGGAAGAVAVTPATSDGATDAPAVETNGACGLPAARPLGCACTTSTQCGDNLCMAYYCGMPARCDSLADRRGCWCFLSPSGSQMLCYD
jgi:hypothetical protein